MSSEPLPRLPRAVLCDGRVLITASTPRSRLVGLTRLTRLTADFALLLPRCRSVHTVGMAFALDLVWLDASGRPLRVDSAVPPRRLKWCRRARSVVEAAAGTGTSWSAALDQAAGSSESAGSPEPSVPPDERSVRLLPSSDGGCPS